jgi:hypothetical protein
MEDRIKALEDFQRKWKHYLWIVCTIAGIAGVFFNIRISLLREKLEAATSELESRQREIAQLETRTVKAQSKADQAAIKAGDILLAIEESKKASFAAKDASTEAKSAAQSASSASREANGASLRALEAANKAQATAQVVDGRLHEFEKVLANLQTQISSDRKAVDQAPADPQTLEVLIEGSNLNITFSEGVTPYKEVKLKQSNYDGTIYVPAGFVAQVKGKTTNSDFVVSERLRGRVVNNLTGSNNNWKQK